jgi:hypothetical protein
MRAAIGHGALITFQNKEGVRCAVPLLKLNGEWRGTGSYLKYGLSRSDPLYGTVFALPHNWKPTRKMIIVAERQLKQKGMI